MLRRVAHSSDLNFGRTRRNTDHHLDVRCKDRAALAVYLFDESADHHLSCVEVCDDSVPHRADSLYAWILLVLHEFRLLSEGENLAGAVVDGNDTWLIQHYLVILKNDSICGTEVHRQFLCPKRKCHICVQILYVRKIRR